MLLGVPQFTIQSALTLISLIRCYSPDPTSTLDRRLCTEASRSRTPVEVARQSKAHASRRRKPVGDHASIYSRLLRVNSRPSRGFSESRSSVGYSLLGLTPLMP